MHEELCVGSQEWQRAASLSVRYQVFVVEGKIDRADEFDQYDEKGRIYANLFLDGKPVSTGRFLPENNETARLTRIATLSPYRGNGYGSKIIAALEEYAREAGFRRVIIHAELTAKTFYEELGYQAFSEVYQEDGQDCQSLTKEL